MAHDERPRAADGPPPPWQFRDLRLKSVIVRSSNRQLQARSAGSTLSAVRARSASSLGAPAAHVVAHTISAPSAMAEIPISGRMRLTNGIAHTAWRLSRR
jgi:hypothetical protein